MTPKMRIFLFVNPKSGGNAASALLSEDHAELDFEAGDIVDQTIHLEIYNIADGSSGDKPGFHALKKATKGVPPMSPEKQIRVIVAGGDGTVMWCLTEMGKHRIDTTKLAIGVMPFGTGNDFARALHWSLPSRLQPFADDMQQLKTFIKGWQAAVPVWHDIWELTLNVRKDGEFLRVDQEERVKKPIIDDEGEEVHGEYHNEEPNQHKRKMLKFRVSNYFSIGVESRIGVGFDKARTKSALKNKIVYAQEGLKKTLFGNTISINDSIYELVSYHTDPPTVIFTTTPSAHPLLSHAASLVVVNIPSFASGLDVWGSAKKPGLEGVIPKIVNDAGRQRMGDGCIEFLTFKSATSLGAEVALAGHGRRVHQGQGPFELHFEYTKTARVYFQVDGEFFAMVNPENARLEHGFRIPVLSNHDNPKLETHCKRVEEE